ncbi:MAG: GNAT family N-acetyltransferase [Actinomycetota bacterium]
MTDLEPLLRFWRAFDDRAERVEPTWWGAVVADPRFPTIEDVNYARVETAGPDLTLAEVESVLLPALDWSRATRVHIVLFYPEELTGLVAELGARGDRLSWDTAMEYRGDGAPRTGEVAVEEIREFDDAFWQRHRDSMREFGVTEASDLDPILRFERETVLPAGRRCLTVREDGRMVAFGSFLVLAEVGYIDHVVTFPEARGRGYASAIVNRIVEEFTRTGAGHLYLLAESDGGPISLYERLGFVKVGQIASSMRPADSRSGLGP